MQDDRQAILDLFTTWQTASASRDLPKLLTLMAEDVVFLRPGLPPMQGKDAFAETFQAIPAQMKLKVPEWRAEELQIEGNWAYCWCYLVVSLTPVSGEPAHRQAGNTLTILRKKPDGAWVLARDANMLAPQK